MKQQKNKEAIAWAVRSPYSFRAALLSARSTEWGTDYWGEIESEPTEEHARKVAERGNANVYSRTLAGEWQKEV